MYTYSSPRHITEAIGNNQFDYSLRLDPKIYVPSLIEGNISDVAIADTIAIETLVGKNLVSGHGLQHFVFLKHARVPTWICDNHNHVFTFWHEALVGGYISRGSSLVHIDQHTDLGTPLCLPINDDQGIMNNEGICGFRSLEAVEEYANNVLTIADFIVPALVTGLISQVLMVTGGSREGVGTFTWEDNQLKKMQNTEFKIQNSLIVDLDLDYFSQGFDEAETFSTVRYWFARADIITIATSPLFIQQEKAMEILKSLQNELVSL